MKFLYLIMGNFDFPQDIASIRDDITVIGVKTIVQAVKAAKDYQDKVDAIELCGAFGEYGAKRIIRETDGKLPVGYIIHLNEQQSLCDRVFRG